MSEFDTSKFDAHDPFAANNVTNYKHVVDAAALKQSQMDAETIRQQGRNYGTLMEQNQMLFERLMAQDAQLFNVALTALTNMVVMSTKELNPGSAAEINEDAVGAKVVSQLSPTISKAVDAAVAEHATSASVDQSAIAAAVAAAVAAVLGEDKD